MSAVLLATGLTACLGLSGCGPGAETQANALLASGMAKAAKGAYDEVIVGALQLSAERLAELLDENKERNLPAAGERR